MPTTPHAYYSTVAGEKQLDRMACWAASLAWWSKVAPDCPTITQAQALKDYKHLWDSESISSDSKYGGIDKESFKSIFGDPKWKLLVKFQKGSSITASALKSLVSKEFLPDCPRTLPVPMVYKDPDSGGNHCVVLYGVDETGSSTYEPVIHIMDPATGKHRVRDFKLVTSSDTVACAYRDD